MTGPRQVIQRAGASTHFIAPNDGQEPGWDRNDTDELFDVDRHLGSARRDYYAGLLLPGGVKSPDKLRMNEDAVGFARAFFDRQKSIAAICHCRGH
jgi:protease I